jgi:hypothetical protein
MKIQLSRRQFQALAAGALLAATGAAFALTTTGAGSSIGATAFVTNTVPFTTGGLATFAQITSAMINITIQPGTQGYIRTRFSAESLCGGEGSLGDKCSVRIITAGVANTPNSALDYAFDSWNQPTCCGADTTPEAHALESLSGLLQAGTYQVKAQAACSSGCAFTLDDWTLTSEVLIVPMS